MRCGPFFSLALGLPIAQNTSTWLILAHRSRSAVSIHPGAIIRTSKKPGPVTLHLAGVVADRALFQKTVASRWSEREKANATLQIERESSQQRDNTERLEWRPWGQSGSSEDTEGIRLGLSSRSWCKKWAGKKHKNELQSSLFVGKGNKNLPSRSGNPMNCIGITVRRC